MSTLEEQRIKFNEEISAIEWDMAIIRSQIEVRSQEQGVDRSWLARAKSALRFKGAMHQQLLQDRSKLVKAIKQQERPFSDYFREAAFGKLSPLMYQELMQAARDIRSGK